MRNVQVLVSGVDRFDVWVQVLACLGDMGAFMCEHTDRTHNTRTVVLRTAYSNESLERALKQYVPHNVPFAVQEQCKEQCHDRRQMVA